jgi:TolB-like protein/Flp pilus assembly protein TadD
LSLIAELQRRRVFRAIVGYGVVAFAMLQIIEPIMHGLHWPDAVLTSVVAALGVGFPVVVVLAWIFDVNQGRVERTAPVAGVSRARLALTLLGLGLLAASPGVAWLLYRHGGAQKAAASAEGTPSIAVLSFADLSPEHNQDYFSDGIAEEILNALARVKGLRVAGRTSSFQFKGKNEDLRAIGETLGVANVLEGSVRKQGNRVRITAQLVQAADGFHLWSNTFDGELTDVFALQESIARAITGELKVVLQGGQNTRLVPVATADPEAYALYLQATAVINKRDYPHLGEAIGWLEQALKLDPKFARGHARLATAHALGLQFGTSREQAERHARIASELDPLLAEPWVALGLVAGQERRLLDGRDALSRAIELDPDDALVNLHSAQALTQAGYTKAGLAQLDHALAVDPVLPNALFWRGMLAAFAGDEDTAERMLTRARSLGLSFADIGLAEVAIARGDPKRARALIGEFNTLYQQCLKDPATSVPLLLDAGYGGDAKAIDQARPAVDACLASQEKLNPWVVRFLFLADPPRALDAIGKGPTANEANVFLTLWSPMGQAARRAPGFPAFARKTGLAELWDRHGPPDGCRRASERDYVCD